jgi:gliding motility-associated-like protein
MKKMNRIIKIIVFVLLANYGFAQTYTQPCISDTRLNRNDHANCSAWQTSNYGASTSLQSSTWTYVGLGCGQGDIRFLVEFDVNPLTSPQSLYDNRATLNLFFPTGSAEEHFYTGSGTDNQFYIQHVTANWLENVVTWNTQPATTAVGQITVPSAAVNPSTQDYQIDVSTLVYEWICGTTPNFGFKMTLVNEGQTYRRVTFASREHPTPALQPTLALEYAYIAATGPDTICEGDAFNVSCALNNANNPANYNYQWVHTNSGTNYVTQNLVNPTWILGLNTYIVTVTNPWCQTAKDTVEIFVEAQPIADAGNDTSICTGQNVQLTATGGTSYSWSNGGNTAGINVSPAATTTYVVTVSNGNCSATDDVIVTISATPIANAGNDTAICINDQASLLATGGGSFLWSNGATTAANTVTPLVTTTYTVTIDNGGCTASDDVVVTVNDYPQISLQKTDAHCGQLDGSVVANVSGGSGVYTYSWSPIASTNSQINNIPAGNYTVTVTSEGCSTLSSITVSDLAGPQAVFSMSASVTDVDQVIYFYDYSIGATSWYWTFGDGNTSVLQNPTNTYSTPGNYDVWLYVEDNYGCRDSTSQIIKVNNAFMIHIPNSFSPNGDGINDIFIPLGIRIDEEHYIMQIFDRWGKKIFETTDVYAGWNGTVNGKSISDKDLMTATFVYYIYVVEEGTDADHEYRGGINLIR